MKYAISITSLTIGVLLLVTNIFGLFKSIEPNEFDPAELRFSRDSSYSYQKALSDIQKRPEESNFEFADRVTSNISRRLTHIEWLAISDTSKYNQLIPIWENYLLYFMGKYSGIPEYKKYHFANYKRSLKRGIGVCGDASMILSQVLNKHQIENTILTYPGHVIVSANISGEEKLFDPDFGVTIPTNTAELVEKPNLVKTFYKERGYPTEDSDWLSSTYATGKFTRWDGVSHFITKKYYFEKFAYAVKWPLPILMMAIPIIFFIRKRSENTNSAFDK